MSDNEEDKEFQIKPKPIDKIDDREMELIIEHYRRLSGIWRGLIPTIWSVPTVAAAINIGAYSIVFKNYADIDQLPNAIILLILLLLNVIFTIGVWKHRYMQGVFGRRLMIIEKYANIKPVEFTPRQQNISGSRYYVGLMIAISLINFGYLVKLLIQSICKL